MPMLKHATFRQLAALHAVARLGSVSRAADELHLTQPAVSIQIGMLEEAAGAPLMQRIGRGIRLTEAGELLSGYAGRILDLWREAGEEMDSQSGMFSGTLRVGAVTTAEYLLPPMLVSFVDENPRVKVKLEVGNRDYILQLLARQEMDLAIMGRPPRELKTTSARLRQAPDGLHRLAHPPADEPATAEPGRRGRGQPDGARARLRHACHGGAPVQGRPRRAAHRLGDVEQRGHQAHVQRGAGHRLPLAAHLRAGARGRAARASCRCLATRSSATGS